ncbi:MAG: hypothetical protein QOF73_5456 [Thermomicrobiales bacterium]|nr:hypothetical protein [Thermomicrobiales bacterium]
MEDESNVTSIQVVFPEADNRQLRITVGPAKLRIAPGDGELWVSGTYRDPTGRTPCRVTTEGAKARISQDHRWRGLLRNAPVFDLQLGKAQPYGLTLESGATDDSACDLGGLPLTSLDVRHGAGKLDLDFSAPNPLPMDRFHLQAGAAETEVTNLANANAAEVTIEGGAASFTLDFGGTPQRDARVKINAGAASVEVRVPATTAAKITPHAILGSVEAGDGFMTREGAYWTEGAVAGGTPVLTIDASVALGSLRLRAT